MTALFATCDWQQDLPPPQPTVEPYLHLRVLGRRTYQPVWEAMRAFTDTRLPNSADEVWLVEHDPVFTLGQAGRPEHLLRDIGVPVVRIDRGGQITYHGPGQVVVYVLIDLARRGLKVRELVAMMEESVLQTLTCYGLSGARRDGAPGVYVGDAKIAALGLRIRNGCSYHGLALNVDLDLAPFAAINPCGYEGMETTRLLDLGVHATLDEVGRVLLTQLCQLLPSVRSA